LFHKRTFYVAKAWHSAVTVVFFFSWRYVCEVLPRSLCVISEWLSMHVSQCRS